MKNPEEAQPPLRLLTEYQKIPYKMLPGKIMEVCNSLCRRGSKGEGQAESPLLLSYVQTQDGYEEKLFTILPHQQYFPNSDSVQTLGYSIQEADPITKEPICLYSVSPSGMTYNNELKDGKSTNRLLWQDVYGCLENCISIEQLKLLARDFSPQRLFNEIGYGYKPCNSIPGLASILDPKRDPDKRREDLEKAFQEAPFIYGNLLSSFTLPKDNNPHRRQWELLINGGSKRGFNQVLASIVPQLQDPNFIEFAEESEKKGLRNELCIIGLGALGVLALESTFSPDFPSPIHLLPFLTMTPIVVRSLASSLRHLDFLDSRSRQKSQAEHPGNK
ncbi:MAG: hypothetical protein Q7S61_04310 [bacterium]|nr:hypothetical protein [bacterium]